MRSSSDSRSLVMVVSANPSRIPLLTVQLAVLIFNCFCSCSLTLPQNMNIPVLLPILPPCWADAEGWELRWFAAGVSSIPIHAAPGTTVSLPLPRGEEAAIMCCAVFGNKRSLPYGAPWPQWLSDDGLLRPDAAGGFAASLAAPFYRAGCSCCGIDLRRLALEAKTRLEDPWDVDPSILTNIVAEGRFRVDYLVSTPVVKVTVTGLPCALASDSPWGSAIEPDSTGIADVCIAQDRVRRWFGGGYTLVLEASSSCACSWTLAGPGATSP